MRPHYLRLFGIVFSTLILVLLGVLWINGVEAGPFETDFAPTYSLEEAAERVALAQEHNRAQMFDQVVDNPDVALLPHMQTVYFPLSGHHLSNRTGFLDFWRANGQVNVFGYPISEEIVEDGRIVQYFERARFEYVPGNETVPSSVQLGLIGQEALRGPMQDFAIYTPSTFPTDPLNGSRYFPLTGHTIIGVFQQYWEKHGGLEVFGYPVTEEFVDPSGRVVQFFERARMEYFPEENFYGGVVRTLREVQLTDLGRQVAEMHGIDTSPVGQRAGTAEWSPALWERRIEVNLSTQWLVAYEGDLAVYDAPVATGKNGFNTPAGTFAVYDKLQAQTMTGSAGGETWEVPGVPWVMYVYGGVAIHGTYWHNAFGTGYRPSHGCINASIDDAQWLYEWADIGVPVHVYY